MRGFIYPVGRLACHAGGSPVVEASLRTNEQTSEELVAECGDLGVMEVPPGENAAEICSYLGRA